MNTSEKNKDQPLKIFFVWGSMMIGGAESAAIELAKSLQSRGHEVIFVSAGGPNVKVLEELGIRHYTSPLETKNPFQMIRCSYEIQKVAQKERVDVFYCDGIAPTIVAYMAARRQARGKKRAGVVAVVHGHEYHFYYAISGVLYNLVSDHVTAVCEYDRSRLMAHGLRPHRVSTIPNAMPREKMKETGGDPHVLHRELSLEEGVPLVGYVGRLSPEKDLGTFLRAIPHIVEKVPQAQFVLIGDGPEREHLTWLAGELDITRHLHFTGFRRDIPQLLPSLSLLVLTSTRELFPMVTLEALFQKRPVVATDVGGVAEAVIDNETGFTVPPCRPEVFAEKVVHLLERPKLRRKMGERGHEMVIEKYALDKTTTQLEEILEKYA